MKKSAVHVTDHALLRYIQRVLGVDIELHRRQVGRSIDKVMIEGACGVIIEGFSYRLEGMTVTTVVEASLPDVRHRKRRGRRRD